MNLKYFTFLLQQLFKTPRDKLNLFLKRKKTKETNFQTEGGPFFEQIKITKIICGKLYSPWNR